MDKPEATGGKDTRKAAVCYVPYLGWMPALAFLFLEKNRDLRWHAVQSLLLHAVLAGVYWVAVPLLKMTIILAPVAWILSGLTGVGFLVFMLWSVVRVNEGGEVKVPVVSEWVRKIVK